MNSIKVVVIGDGAVGKSSILFSYTTNGINVDYTPTIFDNYSALVMHKKVAYQLSLWDTAGQQEYSKLRRLSYPQTDVFLLCYSVINPSSYDNILDSWKKEVESNCPGVPIVLVGTQMDLRTNQTIMDKLEQRNLAPITTEQGLDLSKQINAKAFVESSALTQKNLHLVFEKVIDVYEQSRYLKEGKQKKINRNLYKENIKKKCSIM